MSTPQRNLSFLDVVAQYSSFPQPDPVDRSLPEPADRSFPDPAGRPSSGPNDRDPDEEDLGKLVERADPPQSHLDPEYSYSYLHLNLHESRALVAKFRAADPDNNGLTLEQFSKVTGTFLASKTTSDPAAIFAIFDTALSGRVTLREFLCGYAILCKGTTDTRIRYIFNMFDTDDEGVLNRKQLTAALKLIEAYARSAETAACAQSLPAESALSNPVPIPGVAVALPESEVARERCSATSDDDDDDSDDGPEDLVDDIVDSLLDGEDEISYEEFITVCKQEANVLLWLEKLAEGTGEFLEESVRAASERHVVELNMQRAKIIGIGSPPQNPRIIVPAEAGTDNRPGSYTNRVPRGAGSLPRSRSVGAKPVSVEPTADTASTDEPVGVDVADVVVPVPAPSAAAPVVVRRAFCQKGSTGDHRDAVKQPFIIDYKQIKFDKVIGRGACATVWAGEWLHMPVAVKVFNEDDDTPASVDGDNAGAGSLDRKLVGDLIAEAGVLMQVRHPNVCLFLCLCIEPKVCIVSELYLGGSVHEYLHGSTPHRFTPKQALEMIADVARGMTYLHFSDPVILHRDLKSRNILVDRNVTHCVICDFGVSRLQEQTNDLLSGRGGMVGSVNTMAPEVMEGKVYTRASDVYSFGMVAYEMFTGCVPFKGLRAIQLMFMVTEGERPIIDEAFVPQELKSLLEQCWASDPSSRPDFDSVMTILHGDALRGQVDALEERLCGSKERLSGKSVAGLSKALIDAAHAGHVDEARGLLSLGADVHYADYDLRTALHIACAEGHVHVVDELLRAGANPNAKDRWGGTACVDAKRNGHDSVAARLRVAGAIPKGSGEAHASEVHQLAPSKELVSTGGVTSSADSTEIVAMKLALELMVAVYAGNLDKCRSLLTSGYPVDGVDYDGRTPLHLSVSLGNVAAVSLLLEHGCDTCIPDRWGNTPLDEAVRLNRSGIVALIEVARARERLRSSSEG